jgi:hypothetical protein
MILYWTIFCGDDNLGFPNNIGTNIHVQSILKCEMITDATDRQNCIQ